MKNITLFIFLFTAAIFPAQKKTFTSTENLVKAIIPDAKVNSWMLIYNEYGKDTVLKQSGDKINYMPQFSGFRIDHNEDHYFYIAYSEKGEIFYIKDLAELKKFAGSISNAEEAALAAVSQGYFIDFEFKDYAANFQDFGNTYGVEAAKITSTECPLAKNHYLITVDKSTGAILSEKDLGMYNELYKKDCKNNPQYDVVKQQVEEARIKAEEQKKIQDKINAKMKQRLEKNRRKD